MNEQRRPAIDFSKRFPHNWCFCSENPFPTDAFSCGNTRTLAAKSPHLGEIRIRTKMVPIRCMRPIWAFRFRFVSECVHCRRISLLFCGSFPHSWMTRSQIFFPRNELQALWRDEWHLLLYIQQKKHGIYKEGNLGNRCIWNLSTSVLSVKMILLRNQRFIVQ